jgi:hypothetical protein
MNQIFGLTIESLVAVLLLLTILYCARLNSRLKLLKADERAMKTTITELVLATENAERAIGMLNSTQRGAEDTLATQLRSADMFNTAIAENLKAGEDVLDRLRKIAFAGGMLDRGETRPEAAPKPQPQPAVVAEPPAVLDTSAMVAAAKAFAERTSVRVRAAA